MLTRVCRNIGVLVPLVLILFSAACSPSLATLPSLPFKSDQLPPNTYGVVDNSTFYEKVVIGYQGWFGCPDDGSEYDQWIHWFQYDNISSISKLTVDYFPDVSELEKSELCPTGIFNSKGEELFLYSNYNPLTVKRHFLWMAQAGIDGVEVQRFASVFLHRERRLHQDQVLENIVKGAEAYGRIFYIQYDGLDEKQLLQLIKDDWQRLVDEEKITESPSYLHHNGLPVVGLFGMGFNGREVTPAEAADLIDFFQNNPDPKYRATVQGGVPTFWRTLERDSSNDPAWADVYRSYDILNPWHVSTITDSEFADIFLQNTIIPDIQEANAYGIDYMPVIFPGFSWNNMKHDGYNKTPRQGGTFLWHLAVNMISQGVRMIEIAMFDEVDEGTAIYKVLTTPEELPPGEVLIPLNIDGYNLPSDWYLTLAGRITEMLRGERPVTNTIEGLPARSLAGKRLVYLVFSTGGNWNNLAFENPDAFDTIETISLEGEITNISKSASGINISHPLKNAQAGQVVTARLVFWISDGFDQETLNFTLTKGSIGTAMLRFYTLEGGEEITIKTVSHRITANDTTGTNPYHFSVILPRIK